MAEDSTRDFAGGVLVRSVESAVMSKGGTCEK